MNSDHGRADDSHMLPTNLHRLSPKQHIMIQVVCTPHIRMKRMPLTKVGCQILVNVVACIYNIYIIYIYMMISKL